MIKYEEFTETYNNLGCESMAILYKNSINEEEIETIEIDNVSGKKLEVENIVDGWINDFTQSKENYSILHWCIKN